MSEKLKKQIVLDKERLRGKVVCNIRDYIAVPKVLLAVDKISVRAVYLYIKLLLIAGPKRELNIAQYWEPLRKEMDLTEDFLLESFEILCTPMDILGGKSFILYSVETDDLVITDLSQINKDFMDKVRYDSSPDIKEVIAKQGEVKAAKVSKRDIQELNRKAFKNLAEYKNLDAISPEFLARENQAIDFVRRLRWTPRTRPWDEEKINDERVARQMYEKFTRKQHREGVADDIHPSGEEADSS